MLNKKEKVKLNSSHYLKKFNKKGELKFTIKKSEFDYHTMYPESIVNLKTTELDRRTLYPKTMIRLDSK